ncbi:hypothetical protein [Acidiplasma cupricumulans]|uniref:hypothetical protein n=1 Tax=Acidiplasma cupricumulans TaxID=312540 RepID=UPI000AADB87A|nr:hypothetical protein [Acidiplasma cupricumulans]
MSTINSSFHIYFLTGFSTNYVNFSIFQFLVGLGIGADYPISSSIQAEFSPKR